MYVTTKYETTGHEATVSDNLPLLPLLLEEVPAGLVRALAQEGIPFLRRTDAATGGRFVLFDSRNGPCPVLGAGQVAIDVDRLRSGSAGDPMEALLDERSCHRRLFASGRLVVLPNMRS